ncbi:MAG TPA: 3-dehydroquinate synthase family protein [Spirochaetia bacterium]|nr:3-dehydroquinate synthase family protein [Spirochaetales bacterium]HRS65068.1 3-dehydroquinate synthase family protein [Spirochaetia bacterium]HPD80413.1 3-dehydroquinate synthase family protein [Spirochaetales bacterium]HQG39275.1 3-dehydroquinate synthase family protein [Spirochaetales bacterium]HQK34325.1 3-dehydroquinate synthase family protein [Spirochaetales bacterium]
MKLLPFPHHAHTAIQELINTQRCVIIIDKNITKCYHIPFDRENLLILPQGECAKSFTTVKKILKKITRSQFDRSCSLIGIGGGALCDTVGFTASIYMRGISAVYVPTTLLAQIDAAYGGKTAINFMGIKNLVGTFHNPHKIISDSAFIESQNTREYYSGLGEVLKYAIGFDSELFSTVKNNYESIIQRDTHVLDTIITTCTSIKDSIVKHDMYDAHVRKKLNLGHTFGHAYEQAIHLSHGHAVALGIVASSILSKNMGILPANDFFEIINCMKLYGFNTSLPRLTKKMKTLLIHDKKILNKTIDFIIIEKIGKTDIINLELTKVLELVYG